jgi:uncharacterized membrane protein YGL010W
MRKIDSLIDIYGESHQNKINKKIHWICVPLIMFSLVGLIMAIPFFLDKTLLANWATILLILALLYYLTLSFTLFIGFLIISFLLLIGNYALYLLCQSSESNHLIISVLVFTVGWIGQFIGHKIEGKKPSFLQDIQFLLIGPAWLLHFLLKKYRIRY